MDEEGSAGSPRSSPSPLSNNQQQQQQQVDKDVGIHPMNNTVSLQKDCNGDLWSFLKKEGGAEEEVCKSEEDEEEQQLRARLSHLPFPGITSYFQVSPQRNPCQDNLPPLPRSPPRQPPPPPLHLPLPLLPTCRTTCLGGSASGNS